MQRQGDTAPSRVCQADQPRFFRFSYPRAQGGSHSGPGPHRSGWWLKPSWRPVPRSSSGAPQA
jgi:hypothetical protein